MKNKKILAAVLAATLTFGTVAFSGCRDKDKDTAQTPTTESVQTTNDNMIMTEQGGSGIQMLSVVIDPSEYADYGVSEVAESAHLVTASYPEGEYVSNTAVDWWVEFVDADSDWATGKKASDYVTVTPTSDGALTAVVEGLQAFGEPIRLVCASRQSPDRSDSFICDYKSFVRSMNLKFECLYDDLEYDDVANNSIELVAESFLMQESNGIVFANVKEDTEIHAEGRHFVDVSAKEYTTGTYIAENVTYQLLLGMPEWWVFGSLIQESDILTFFTDDITDDWSDEYKLKYQIIDISDYPVNLALPGLQYLCVDDQLAVLYHWANQQYGAEIPADYEGQRDKFTEYMRILNEYIALRESEYAEHNADFVLAQHIFIESSDGMNSPTAWNGNTVVGYDYRPLIYSLDIQYTDTSKFIAEATSLTLDTDHILFEP